MIAPLRYKRVLLKVSGEALLGERAFGIDDDHDRADRRRRRGGASGSASRSAWSSAAATSSAASTIAKAGGNRVAGDQMGMLATVMNAIAFQQKLDERRVASRLFSAVAMPTICETFNQRIAEAAFEAGEVLLFAGGIGHPFVTTDTGAALRAAEMGCDALFKGTQVDGVYSADPKTDKTATRYDRLSYDDVLRQGLGVMDLAAIALARDNRIPVIVFSIKQPGAFVDILKGRGRATVVAEG